MPAKLIGDHGRFRSNAGNDGDAYAHPPDGLDDGSQVTIAGEQERMVDAVRDFQRVDRELDTDAALHTPPPVAVVMLLGRLSSDRVSVVVEPIHQRPKAAELVVVPHKCDEISRGTSFLETLSKAEELFNAILYE